MGKSGKLSKPGDPPHIPRPSNSWILFRTEWIAAHKEELERQKLDMRGMSAAASAVWRGFGDGDKLYWTRRADTVKLEHAQKYPEYKFRPRKAHKVQEKDKEEGGEGAKVKAKRKDSSQGGRSKKKRRVGEPLTNAVLDTIPVMDGEVIATPSLVDHEESFTPVASSSKIVAPEASPTMTQPAYDSPSFATQDHLFTFTMPYPPTVPGIEYDTYANATVESDANAFHFTEGFELPHPDIELAQYVYAAEAVPGAYYLENLSGCPQYSQTLQLPVDLRGDATSDNKADAHHLGPDYHWLTMGGYEADVTMFAEPEAECYVDENIDEAVFDYATHYAEAVASIFSQEAPSIAMRSKL